MLFETSWFTIKMGEADCRYYLLNFRIGKTYLGWPVLLLILWPDDDNTESLELTLLNSFDCLPLGRSAGSIASENYQI